MNILPQNLNGRGLRIGIVQARFTNEIGSAMVEVARKKLIELGVDDDDITLATVAGALEVPLVLQNLANSEEFDALIAFGAVIRGETYHFELVSNESGAGVTRVGLDFNIPIANAILTTENDEQAHARIQEKATDAALVAVETANLPYRRCTKPPSIKYRRKKWRKTRANTPISKMPTTNCSPPYFSAHTASNANTCSKSARIWTATKT